jgi:O-antigen/teichoic acid export membrane protein
MARTTLAQNQRMQRTWYVTFCANGLIIASALAGSVLAARLLGAEGRGLLAAVIFWPHFFAGLGNCGLNEAIAIRTARLGTTSTIRATTLALSLGVAVPVVFLGAYFLQYLLIGTRSAYLPFSEAYFALFVPLMFLATNFLAIDQGEFRFVRFNVLRVAQSISYPVLLLLFWVSDLISVQTAAIAVLSGTALAALVRLWIAREGLTQRPSVHEAKTVLTSGIRLHATNLAMFLASEVDKLVLIQFATDHDVGIYVVALSAVAAVQALAVQTFINIMLPKAAHLGLSTTTKNAIYQPLAKLTVALFATSVLLAIAIPFLLPLIFGNDFKGSVLVAQVLAFALAFGGIKKAILYLLRAWNLNLSAGIAETLTAVILILFAFPAFDAWGLIGVAFVVLSAQVVGTAFLFLSFARHLTVPNAATATEQ